jgi:hypothetical protein
MKIEWLDIADSPGLWRELGFFVDEGGSCRIGGVEHRLLGTQDTRRGVVGWGIADVGESIVDTIELIDGIATTSPSGLPPDIGENAFGLHPNGVYEIDHLVITTSSTPRTVSAFSDLGLERRGDRTVNHAGDAVDMTFLWAGQTLLEIAGPATPDDGGKPARIAGLAYSTSDIDAAAALLGHRMTVPKDAVQPGRRIAAVRKDVGSTVPIAFMTPHVR